MSMRFKVLAAMLALKEFTVLDLHDFSGVKLDTVRVVVGRDKHFLKEVGVEIRPGTSGGRYKRYKLRENMRDELRSQLRDLFNIPGIVHDNTLAVATPDTIRPPVSLEVAEYLLLTKLSETTLPPKDAKALIQSASLNLNTAERELLASRSIDPHSAEAVLRRFRLLDKFRRFCQILILGHNDRHPLHSSPTELWAELHSTLVSSLSLEDPPLRLLSVSILSHPLTVSAVTVHKPGFLESGLGEAPTNPHSTEDNCLASILASSEKELYRSLAQELRPEAPKIITSLRQFAAESDSSAREPRFVQRLTKVLIQFLNEWSVDYASVYELEEVLSLCVSFRLHSVAPQILSAARRGEHSLPRNDLRKARRLCSDALLQLGMNDEAEQIIIRECRAASTSSDVLNMKSSLKKLFESWKTHRQDKKWMLDFLDSVLPGLSPRAMFPFLEIVGDMNIRLAPGWSGEITGEVLTVEDTTQAFEHAAIGRLSVAALNDEQIYALDAYHEQHSQLPTVQQLMATIC